MTGDSQLLIGTLVRLVRECGETVTWVSGSPGAQLHVDATITLSREELYALQRALGKKVGR